MKKLCGSPLVVTVVFTQIPQLTSICARIAFVSIRHIQPRSAFQRRTAQEEEGQRFYLRDIEILSVRPEDHSECCHQDP